LFCFGDVVREVEGRGGGGGGGGGVTVFVQEKRNIYLAIELSLREISYVVYAHALMCAR